MNILIINYDYPPVGGGAANAAQYLACFLNRLGNQVSVLTSAYKDYIGYTKENEVDVYRIPAIRKAKDRSNVIEMISFVKSAYRNLPKIVIEKKIDKAIIFFTIPCGPLGLFLKKKYGIPYIISLRGGDVPFHVRQLNFYHKILQPYRQKILKNASHIVANSESFARLSMRTDPFEVSVIHNGVDTDSIDNIECLSSVNKTNFQIVFAGRFQPEKNCIYLLQQIKMLKTTGLKFQLHLVGDGPLKNNILEFIEENSLQDVVIYHGWLEKNTLLQLFKAADCLVNPSTGEGMPNVVLEAMACGLPVIASNVTGNDAVVKHGVTGYLFNINQPEQLLQHILILSSDRKLSKKMGEEGKNWVKKDFTWQTAAEKYLCLLEN